MKHLFGLVLLALGVLVGSRMFYPDTIVNISQAVLPPADKSLTLAAARAGRSNANIDVIPSAHANDARVLTRDDLSRLHFVTYHDRVSEFSPGQALWSAAQRVDDHSRVAAFAADRLLTAQLATDPTVPTAKAVFAAQRTLSHEDDPAPLSGWTASVAYEPGVRVVDGQPVAIGRTKIESEKQLAAALQHELKLLGCYRGKVDGVWGPMSQMATLAFMEAVNASLPDPEPDVVLLWLARAQQTQVCTTPCRGQFARDASCQTRSVIASANTREPAAEPRMRTVAVPLPVRRPAKDAAIQVAKKSTPAWAQNTYGRMSLGAASRKVGPRAEADRASTVAASDEIIPPRPQPVTIARRGLGNLEFDRQYRDTETASDPILVSRAVVSPRAPTGRANGTANSAYPVTATEVQSRKQAKRRTAKVRTKARKRRTARKQRYRKRRYTRSTRQIFTRPLHNIY